MTTPANNMEKMVDIFSQQIQELETVALEVLIDTRIANAEGNQLDVIGAIVGLGRSDLSDTDYRSRLLVKILVNQASGTIPEILAIIEILIGNDQLITVSEHFPAAMIIRIDDALVVPIAVLAASVTGARSGGVNTSIEFTLVDDDDTFKFAEADAVQASNRQGFSNDAGTSGGKFAFVEEV